MDIKYEIVNGCWECISHTCNRDGYPVITIKRKTTTISRYYYSLYKGKIPKGYVVRHTCDNKKCIKPDHLIVGTHLDNVRDRVKRNRSAVGEKSGKSKLTEKQIEEIFLNKDKTLKELATLFEVDKTTISSILSNKSWADSAKKFKQETFNSRKKGGEGSKNVSVKLTEEQVKEIFQNKEDTLKFLAEKYNVSCDTIWKIRKEIRWVHITGKL